MKLAEVAPISPDINAAMLFHAEYLVAEIKAGRVASVAICYVDVGGGNTNMFKTNGLGYSLMGALQMLQSRIIKFMGDD